MKAMGKLLDALTPPSPYRAKQTGIWEEIVDRVQGALTRQMLADVDTWILQHELQIPRSWADDILELMDKRLDEIEAEDIGQILRDRFDFT